MLPCRAEPQGDTTIARARLTIDLGAVASNWRALDALSGPGVETAAVVKADAYGLGAATVAPTLAAAGAKSFFVALAEEGASLRAALGPEPAIYVFDGLMRGDDALCRAHGLIPCLDGPEQVQDFVDKCADLSCALQLDSGMNRLGLEAAELAAIAPLLPKLDLRLVMSHLACADAPDHPQNAAQHSEFTSFCARLPSARRSLAATGGVLLGAAYHFDLTRPGIGLYGGAPFAAARPVVTLALPVVQVRDVAAGESVGYGAAWTATRPSRIATLGAGYADGLIRGIGGGDVRLFAGATGCPLVGRVSMDLITVDVTDLRGEVPDRLEILNARQTVDDLAAAGGTIGYEILTSLGARYERVYLGASPGPGPCA